MKRLKLFAMSSCLGLALTVSAAAQQQDQDTMRDQDRQTQIDQERQPPARAETDGAWAEAGVDREQDALPRTASPLPLAGLAGLLSLGAAAGLRALRRNG